MGERNTGAALLAISMSLTVASSAMATGYKSAPEYVSLSKSFRITSEVTCDLDANSVDESAVAYRTADGGTAEGGLVLFAPKGGGFKTVFHVFFDSTYIAQLSCKGDKLSMVLVRARAGENENLQLTWTYGKELVFDDDKRSPLYGRRALSSCRARDSGVAPGNVIDGDLDTAWAEGVPGTGVGESVTVKLLKPVGVGLIGVFPGHSPDAKAFKRTNRIHRATLEIQTESDIGDEAAALDFSDLGIDVGGDTEQLTFANRPEITFFKLKRRKALNLVLKIDSVFLGDKDDDTHIAEIEIVPLVPRTETLDKATKLAAPGTPKVTGAVIGSN